MPLTVFRQSGRLFVYHCLFWISMTIFSYLVALIQDNIGGVYILDAVGKYMISAFVFYANTELLFPLLFARKKYGLFVLGLCTVLVLAFLLKCLLYLYLFRFTGFPEIPYTLVQSFIMLIWWWLQYTLFATAYWYTQQALITEKKQLKLEGEKLKIEFAYLRAQVDPHFLYNVLNVFYSKALTLSEELANNIVTLADIMRYSITPDADGKISMAREVEQISNIITINKMRFEEEVTVELHITGVLDNVRIIPFILITLVENAFKHGELLKVKKPLVIDISYQSQTRQLKAVVSNSRSASPNWKSFGIGLENIRNRLAIEYGDRYMLHTSEDKEVFIADLRIQF